MSSPLKQIDSNQLKKFKCIKLKDSSIYFGEIAWIDSQGVVYEAPTEDLIKNLDLKQVRHGLGIQLFGNTDDNILCKYEGGWDRDRRSGEGLCLFPDKSVYMGAFCKNLREGEGKLIWPNGDSYEGNWKTERMNGSGTFTQSTGGTLAGNYKDNFYQLDDKFFSPFSPKEELDKLKKRAKDIERFNEQTKSQRLFYLEKTISPDKVASRIQESNLNNRIPVILRSKMSNKTKDEVFLSLSKSTHKEIYEFDLRFAAELKSDKLPYEAYMQNIKNSLARALAYGHHFCINIDESSVKYEQIFDPDLREFFNSKFLPPQILEPKEFQKKEICDSVLLGTDYNEFSFNKGFQIFLWSKFRIDSETDEKKIVEKFEKRFSSFLPVIKLDLTLIL